MKRCCEQTLARFQADLKPAVERRIGEELVPRARELEAGARRLAVQLAQEIVGSVGLAADIELDEETGHVRVENVRPIAPPDRSGPGPIKA